MDNLAWLRTRWIRLIAHGLVLVGIVLFVLIQKEMPVHLIMLMGGLAGFFISRLGVSWAYETRLKKVFTEMNNATSEKTGN